VNLPQSLNSGMQKEDKHITIGHRIHKNGKISSGEHQNDVQHK
jgi:hypothetical protein